jgi:phosphoribosylformylglycinamidine cyclo-ligase
VAIDRGSWPAPPVFDWLRRLGDVAEEELERVFNLGIGLVLVVSPYFAESVRSQLADVGYPSWVIGQVRAGPRGVVWA